MSDHSSNQEEGPGAVRRTLARLPHQPFNIPTGLPAIAVSASARAASVASGTPAFTDAAIIGWIQNQSDLGGYTVVGKSTVTVIRKMTNAQAIAAGFENPGMPPATPLVVVTVHGSFTITTTGAPGAPAVYTLSEINVFLIASTGGLIMTSGPAPCRG
jgi:hypothetical protein